MRDRLIELLSESEINYAQYLYEECDKAIKGDITKQLMKRLEFYANHLLENGVIVPPCKVGDIFYGLNETEYDDYEVLGFKWGKRRGDDEYVLIVLTVYDMEFVWGEEAFATKEEAEQALKGSVS